MISLFVNRHLIAFARGHGAKILKTCLLQLLLTGLGTLISLAAAVIVRMLQGEHKVLFFTSLWQVFLIIALMIAARYVLAKIKAVASEQCSLEIKTALRDRLLHQLFSLGPAYTGRERTGNIASTISNKVEFLNEYYTIYLPSAVSALIHAAVLVAVLSRFNRWTALTCIIGCVGMIVCPMLFYFLMRERGEAEMRAHSQYYSDCLDSIQGMATLKAFNANARQRELIHMKGEELRQAVMGQLRITMLENVVLQFFAGLGSAFSIAVAAYQCAGGHMEQAVLVYALFLISSCFAPLVSLISAWHLGYRGVVASYSIIELLEEPKEMSLSAAEEHTPGDADKEPFHGEIRFDSVSFAYTPQDGNVLNKVSFTIPNQTTTALVGSSGSGKSTIAHLLAGFYPVGEGSVLVDGKPLNEQSVYAIQDQIAAVWQDCRLFYGTVEENILVGKPEATHAQVELAAQNANIHDFIISLPEGYQTVIGEQGMRFSGGERQRIALARAFLRDAPIVILDEATSSLDRRNEMKIQHSLQKLSSGKTSLIIAHRLATIQSADQIIMMENGKISEKGTHKQLLETSENYRCLMGEQLTGGQAYET